MFFPFYSLFDIVAALIFTFYLISSLTLKTQKPNLDKTHRFVLLVALLFCFVDALWGLCNCGILKSSYIFFASTTSIFFLSSIISFCWIIYAAIYLDNAKYKLLFINVGFFCLLLQISILIGNIFNLKLFFITGENKYQAGPFRNIVFFIEMIPFAVVFFLCLYRTVKEINHSLIVISFIFPLVFSAFLQKEFPGLPFFAIGYLTAISITHTFIISRRHDKMILSQNSELQDVFSSITSTFEVISTLNLDTKKEKIFRSTGVMTKGSFSARASISYENKILAFLHDVVYKDDREMVLNEMKIENIWEHIKDGNSYRIHFRTLDDGKIFWYEIRLSLLSNQKKDRKVAIVIRNITTEVLREQKYTNDLIESKQKMQEQLDVLTSLSGIYLTMHLIDLKENSSHCYSKETIVDEYIREASGAKNQIKNVMKNVAQEEFLQTILDFVDLTTVATRMKGKKVISQDFIGKQLGWIRAQFIQIANDEKGKLKLVMFTTQIIDKEKRREEDILKLSKTDDLTKIPNRRAFDEEIKKYSRKIPGNMIVISADVNGLKHINDTKGHSAGDELICASASILTESFQKYGKVFRTGGDEFMALIQSDNFKPLKTDFSNRMKKWKGKEIDSVHISMGYASKTENPSKDILQLSKLADAQMYKEKANFYKESGFERRRRGER